MLTLFFFMIGAALGSFSLVLAWRTEAGKDWVRGRSECDHCKKPLQPTDMIPVLSWLVLRGKCRYCKKPLSRQLFYAEAGLGLVAAVSYLYWPYELLSVPQWLYFGIWLVVLTVMSALLWYDMKWSELPTSFMKVLGGLAVLEAISELLIRGDELSPGLLLALIGSLLCGGLFWLLYKVSKGTWIGDGDSSLGFGLGLLAGSPLGAFILIFVASILGTFVSLPLLTSKKLRMKSKIPFGPFLILAAVIVQLFGAGLVNWYKQLIGL